MVLMVSFSQYEEMVSDRPEKFTPEEVNYREAKGAERCLRCIHFFQSKDRAVCEIMRPDNDEDVEPSYVCNFTTNDGDEYPLLDVKEHSESDDEHDEPAESEEEEHDVYSN